MTTETRQANYINADPKGQKKPQTSNSNPTKLDMDLAIFAVHEEKEGLKPCTVDVHASMVRKALEVISERRTIANHRKINKADLVYVRDTLAERGYRQPGSYARVLAKFVSVVTRREPIIPLGSLTRQVRNPYLLISAPGTLPRRTLGDTEDRKRIEERFGEDIESFLKSQVEAGLSVRTVAIRKKTVSAAIFAYEHVCGTFDPAAATSDDMRRIYSFVKDFDIDEPSKHVAALVQFISFVTGNPPLLKLRAGKPKVDWADEYGKQCPFGKEIQRYNQLMEARDVSGCYVESRVHMAAVVGGMLNARYSVKTLAQVEPEMIDAVMEEIAAHVSASSVKAFLDAFLGLASYFGRDDLREKTKKRKAQAVFVPQDDCDRAFKAKLDAWEGYLKKWEYSEHTMAGRISAVRKCYSVLKKVKGPFSLESLEPFDMQTIRNAMAGYRETTIQNYLYAFGWFLDFAIGRDLFAESHLWFNGIEVNRNFVQMEEFVELWNVGGPLEHMILALGGAMGLRRTEMIRMRVSDLNGSMAIIRGKGAGADGKMMKAEIPQLVRETLAEYLPYREELLSKFGDRSAGMLLINPFEREMCRPLSVRGFQTVLDKLSEAAGISFTSHGLRRMYAMNLSDAGVELDTIRRMMRHADVETTLRCYLHADPRKMQGAVSKVNGAFSGLGLGPKPMDA